MNESELARSLLELDERLATDRDETSPIRSSELLALAKQRRHRGIAKLSVAALLVVGTCLGLWARSQPRLGEEVIASNNGSSELQQVLRETEELIRETEEYLSDFQLHDATYVDDASMVSLAVAESFRQAGLVEESRQELEMLVRVFPDSAGGDEAAKKLVGVDASQQDLNQSLDEGVL